MLVKVRLDKQNEDGFDSCYNSLFGPISGVFIHFGMDIIINK